MRRFRLPTVAVALFAAWSQVAAQDPTPALAAQLVRALAPATDDPTAIVKDLLQAALAAPRSPAAAVLAGEAQSRIDAVADPAALLQWLTAQPATEPRHGALQEILAQITLQLARTTGAPRPTVLYSDRARALAVVGPFGDAGRPSLALPTPVDFGFELGREVAGRTGPVVPRIVVREDGVESLPLQPRDRRAPGCYVARWRVQCTAEAVGFVQVSYRGSYLCRIDGFEVGRNEPEVQPGNTLRRHGVRLAPGQHEIIVRTGDDSDSWLSLRLVDGSGSALANVNEVAPDAPVAADAIPTDPRFDATYRNGLVVFSQAAESAAAVADADGAGALLRLAAAVAAQRNGDVDPMMALLLALDRRPPSDPAACLVLAGLWLRANEFPDEQRTSKARALETSAIAALPKGHHRALLARVRQLEEKDQREEALRLLRQQIAAGSAGPETFATAHAVLRRLNFLAEEEALLEDWLRAFPRSQRPRTLLADRRQEQGSPRAALELLQQGLALDPTADDLRRRAIKLAIALADFDLATKLAEGSRSEPATAIDAMQRMQTMANIALRRGDIDAQKAAMLAIGDSPVADASVHGELAERWFALGDNDRAIAELTKSLERNSDNAPLQDLLAMLRGTKRRGDDFARFRHDGDAAIAAFVPGPQEEQASATLLVDQRIVELYPDGSTLTEIHELRRVNDLQGVEEMRSAPAPAGADDLLLLRTVGKDGKTYVPKRVNNEFAMPRLEPGAFVEWRYRQRTPATGPSPIRLEDFMFASHQEPLRLTEWVVIAPAAIDGTFRQRNGAPEAKVTELDGDRKAYVRTRTDAPRLPTENSPPPAEELLPIAGFGVDATVFPELRRTRLALLSRTRPTPVVTTFASELLANATDDADRVQRIHRYCQDQIQDGDGNDATQVLLRKKGDRFTLAVALLRAAEVPCDFAACASARAELAGVAEPLFAIEDVTDVPCVVVHARSGGAPLWLFADSPHYWPLGAIPAHRSGALAFVILDDRAEKVRVPSAIGAATSIVVTGSVKVTTTKRELEAQVLLGDQTGFQLAEQLRRRTADVQKLAARQIGQQFFPEWRIVAAQPNELEPGGKPLQLQLKLRGAALQEDGDAWLLPLPFPPAEVRKSLGDRDERTMPMRVETDLELSATITIEPGDDLAVVDLPPPVQMQFLSLDYGFTVNRVGRGVRIERRLRVRPGTVPPNLYGDWIRWLDAIDRTEAQRLVLRRVAATAPR